MKHNYKKIIILISIFFVGIFVYFHYSLDKTSLEKRRTDKEFSKLVGVTQSELPAIKKELAPFYSDMTIEEGLDHTVIFNFTLLSSDVDLNLDERDLKQELISQINPVMKIYKEKIPDIKFDVNYWKSNGSIETSVFITSEDID